MWNFLHSIYESPALPSPTASPPGLVEVLNMQITLTLLLLAFPSLKPSLRPPSPYQNGTPFVKPPLIPFPVF